VLKNIAKMMPYLNNDKNFNQFRIHEPQYLKGIFINNKFKLKNIEVMKKELKISKNIMNIAIFKIIK
jgi:hypothetical protein